MPKVFFPGIYHDEGVVSHTEGFRDVVMGTGIVKRRASLGDAPTHSVGDYHSEGRITTKHRVQHY